jgi:transposase
MAYRLKMALIEAIVSLKARGWSNRRIARELGVDRDTVSRQLHSNAAKAPIGVSEVPAEANAAKAPIGSGSGTRSVCEPFRDLILSKLHDGLTAQRIFQDLVGEHGFTAQYHSVRRFVRHLDGSRPLPFRRMECDPGDEVQVDFGTGAPIVGPDGKRRRTHVFRIVLSHSRKGYSEAVYRQTTDEFLRCLENAFQYFGGLPKTIVLDNLKAGVETPDWYDPELNPKLRSFADHYDLAILPTRPRTPRHKGKIESGIGYVKSNALRGRTFAGLEAENAHLLTWETTVADVRIHGTIRRQVGQFFLEVERPALRPLPLERFAFFHEAQRTVHRDGHVEVARAYYSVPPEYLTRRVWVRWDGRIVRVFNDRLELIATHVRHEPGRFSTQRQHIASEKISGMERGAAWLLSQTQRIGPQAARWSEAVVQARGVEGVRVLQGLLALAGKHRSDCLEKACDIAFSYGSYRLKTIRTLLERDAPKQEAFAFMDEHPIIRDLAEYARIAHGAFQKEAR